LPPTAFLTLRKSHEVKEGMREGGRKGGRKGGREEGREGKRERGRERGREGGREGGRERRRCKRFGRRGLETRTFLMLLLFFCSFPPPQAEKTPTLSRIGTWESLMAWGDGVWW
jgi:hypothetical protein